MSHQAYMTEIKRSQEHQAESLVDLDGVSYMKQLAELIAEQNNPLSPVFRTDKETFADVPVTAIWTHGRNSWQSADDPEKSKVIFSVPYEITRRIQSDYAQSVMQRFFGQSNLVRLPEAIGENPIKPEIFTSEIITNDWSMLAKAIQMSAEDSGGYLGGRSVQAITPAGVEVIQARISENRLELYLNSKTVREIQAVWAKAFKREVFLEN
ncbi:MAG: hypothetical protein WA843_04780 [Candidatus Saccharimonadales bacterium]